MDVSSFLANAVTHFTNHNKMPFLSSVESVGGFGRNVPSSGGGGLTPGTLKVNLIGDSSVSTFATGLQTAKTALGYSTVTLTITQTALSNYTGSDLTTANYDVIVIWTNGGLTFNSSFGTNVNNYISNGGKVVFGVFCWGNVPAITNLTYTNTPYIYKGTQGNAVANMTVLLAHPITNGIPTSISGGASTFYTNSVSVQPTATNLATYPDATSMVAIQSGPRRVGINLWPGTGYVNLNKLFVNAIVWAGGLLN